MPGNLILVEASMCYLLDRLELVPTIGWMCDHCWFVTRWTFECGHDRSILSGSANKLITWELTGEIGVNCNILYAIDLSQ